jgi:putative oxidoreductase
MKRNRLRSVESEAATPKPAPDDRNAVRKFLDMSRSLLEENNAHLALLLNRIVFGGLMLKLHGWTKLTHFEAWVPRYPDPLGIGRSGSLLLSVLTQVFAAIFLIVGVRVRLCSFLLATTMLIAAFVVKMGSTLMQRELAILYASAYIVTFLAGGGRFCLERWFSTKH